MVKAIVTGKNIPIPFQNIFVEKLSLTTETNIKINKDFVKSYNGIVILSHSNYKPYSRTFNYAEINR